MGSVTHFVCCVSNALVFDESTVETSLSYCLYFHSVVSRILRSISSVRVYLMILYKSKKVRRWADGRFIAQTEYSSKSLAFCVPYFICSVVLASVFQERTVCFVWSCSFIIGYNCMLTSLFAEH